MAFAGIVKLFENIMNRGGNLTEAVGAVLMQTGRPVWTRQLTTLVSCLVLN
jgi:hypothetical protein